MRSRPPKRLTHPPSRQRASRTSTAGRFHLLQPNSSKSFLLPLGYKRHRRIWDAKPAAAMSGNDSSAAMDPAAQAAAIAEAQAAFRSFTIELFTLFGIGVLSTVLRTYARIKKVGFANLAADDFLVWLGLCCYATQASLGYSIGNFAQGLANNGMTDEQRMRIDVNGKEHELRVLGSQIQVAGWTVYSTLIWCFKLSMLFFYVRLTNGLGRAYRMRVWFGFGLVLATFFSTILTIFLGCRPFNHYWQVTPNPGNHCQPALSDPIVWSSFAANVSTDIYLILIPLDLLWSSTLKLYQKIASTIVLGTGIFVLVCAILKTIYVLVDPVNGAQLAGQWGTREAFTCVITTNLPMVFPLLRQWFGPLLPSFLRSSRYTSGGAKNFTESEERMMGDVRLQRLSKAVPAASVAAAAAEAQQDGVYPPTTRTVTVNEREDDAVVPAGNSIVVSSEVEITSDRASHGEQRPQRPHEAW
ncbi:hypothetical protein MAPG_06043 [Magnaporthiopsis poae ATCC 64411]|uniref:Rhodopsin domain-containing protein n=1 Tax=Magnaporthiopsis poae (strain ATCC 64411 / 73-15) TaxID=644358 RepID=A0A0C4E0Z9_MAGP6|nr:hypothetical protein MAPG_06043 [Magnaporthiopsis poae ATCC 64411]